MALRISRRCLVYTPHTKPLRESVVALVSTAGVHLRHQEPFNMDGDLTFRLLPGEVAGSDLMVTHSHYNHQDADEDINCVFPIDRLRELARDGVIGGVNNKHIGYMGFTTQLRQVYDDVAPKIAATVERSQADIVLLTAG